eukprot:6835796-Pyramimonas_sp.AAC.1
MSTPEFRSELYRMGPHAHVDWSNLIPPAPGRQKPALSKAALSTLRVQKEYLSMCLKQGGYYTIPRDGGGLGERRCFQLLELNPGRRQAGGHFVSRAILASVSKPRQVNPTASSLHHLHLAASSVSAARAMAGEGEGGRENLFGMVARPET